MIIHRDDSLGTNHKPCSHNAFAKDLQRVEQVQTEVCFVSICEARPK